MSFSDPQTVTVNSVDKTLARISVEGTQSVYANSDSAYQLKLAHTVAKSRHRVLARLDHTEIAADPLTSENASQKLGVYLVIDEPQFGFTDAEIDNDVQGFITWLSSANVLKLLAQEH